MKIKLETKDFIKHFPTQHPRGFTIFELKTLSKMLGFDKKYLIRNFEFKSCVSEVLIFKKRDVIKIIDKESKIIKDKNESKIVKKLIEEEIELNFRYKKPKNKKK